MFDSSAKLSNSMTLTPFILTFRLLRERNISSIFRMHHFQVLNERQLSVSRTSACWNCSSNNNRNNNKHIYVITAQFSTASHVNSQPVSISILISICCMEYNPINFNVDNNFHLDNWMRFCFVSQFEGKITMHKTLTVWI